MACGHLCHVKARDLASGTRLHASYRTNISRAPAPHLVLKLQCVCYSLIAFCLTPVAFF
jgi:hypothetical protein